MMYARSGPLLLACALASVLGAGAASGQAITLDFSSGEFSERQFFTNRYDQDGFTVATESAFDEFHMVAGTRNTLAWYEGDIAIRTSFAGGTFTLESIEVVAPPYLGMVFTSSKGETLSIGSITGTIDFTGPGWSEIDSFTVQTRLDGDILSKLDDFVVVPTAVEPIPSVPSLGAGAAVALSIAMGVVGACRVRSTAR